MKPAHVTVRAAALSLVLAALAVFPVSCSRREPGPASAPAETAESLRLKETTVRNVTDHLATEDP